MHLLPFSVKENIMEILSEKPIEVREELHMARGLSERQRFLKKQLQTLEVTELRKKVSQELEEVKKELQRLLILCVLKTGFVCCKRSYLSLQSAIVLSL